MPAKRFPRRNVYTVGYRHYMHEIEKHIDVIASSKEEAYDRAVYEVIPETTGWYPYSAWVISVTYQNGNCKYFNTCDGLPY